MASKEPQMNKIEQVKLLLFGENMDEINERISELEKLVESNSRAFEKAVLDTKNEILDEMRKNHAFMQASLKDTGKDKDTKIVNLQKKTEDEKKALEAKLLEDKKILDNNLANDKKALETKIAKNQKEILDTLKKQNEQINAALANLDLVKAEKQDVAIIFDTMKEAFEKISKVL